MNESIRDHQLFKDLAPHIVDQFFQFHGENPHVFDYFKKFAHQLRQAGRQRFSGRAIVERIRWELAFQTTDEDFKINDHWSPCYVRLLIHDEPEFIDFFEMRHTPGTIPLAVNQ